MNIGELAKRSGLTQSRIRYYESIGLLKSVERRANGYRSYSSGELLVLSLITGAQKAGFSLDEIRALLPSGLEKWEHDSLIGALRRKVEDIEAMQVRLAQSKAHLVSLIEGIETKPDNIDCADNAQRMLSQVMKGEIGAASLDVNDVALLGKAKRRKLATGTR